MSVEAFVQEAQPTAKVGDLWVQPSSGRVRVCIQGAPALVFEDIARAGQAAVANVAGSIPAGGVGAAAGAWDTAANRDTAITTMGEIKTQLNALLARLRALRLIAP